MIPSITHDFCLLWAVVQILASHSRIQSLLKTPCLRDAPGRCSRPCSQLFCNGGVYQLRDVTEVACWTSVGREFYEAQGVGDKFQVG